MGTYDGHNGTVWSVDVDCKFPSSLSKKTRTELVSSQHVPLRSTIISYLYLPRVRISRQHDEALVGQDGRMLDVLGV